MKALVREYLASLKEREELDAILPDLLSELGFNVFSRPRRGTTQHGVDIAAVGADSDGERKVFLFSVKAGDLTRQDWDGNPQALRASLNEIIDVYIKNRLPTRYADKKIVICLAFGGDVQEQVRDNLRGFIDDQSTERISFDEWNGDRIAGYVLEGILREEVLPRPLRSSFQKAVALVDEPDVSYQHFARLLTDLRAKATRSKKERVRAARQINICLWILFVWSRDVENLEAAFRASELSLLSSWELLRPLIGTNGREIKLLSASFRELVSTYMAITTGYLEKCVMPYVGTRHGLSLAARPGNSADVNLTLFELLGRIGVAGAWIFWLAEHAPPEAASEAKASIARLIQTGYDMIANNPALLLPLCDRQATDIVLFLQLCLMGNATDGEFIRDWLTTMVDRLNFTMRGHGRYPTISSDYRDLVDHPRERTDEYFREATVGSTLIPILAVWLHVLGDTTRFGELQSLVGERLQHCTLQLWMPDAESEGPLYFGGSSHGRAITDLSLEHGGATLLTTIGEATRIDDQFEKLSPNITDNWPVILVACRHFKLPVPPQFWIEALTGNGKPAGSES